MGQMKTPGVYIVEKNAFPNSVVEVATAVPAFIGYTEKADNKGKTLLSKPWRITSMSEFISYYGGAPAAKYSIAAKPTKAEIDAETNADKKTKLQNLANAESDFSLNGAEYFLNQTAGKHLLYNSMKLFFQNGGGPCYIVSVGGYDDDVDSGKLKKGIGLLVKEQEPTMVVMPETVLLKEDDSINVQQAALSHCGGKMRNRITILDVWDGEKDRQDPDGDCIEKFRSKLGINFLDFAAAYYPWLNASIVEDSDLNYGNIDNGKMLQTLLREELSLPAPTAASDAPAPAADDASEPAAEPAVTDTTPAAPLTPEQVKLKQKADAVNDITKEAKDWVDGKDIKTEADAANAQTLLNKSLIAMSPLYGNILTAIKLKLNLLPPSAAMAGVYTMVDNTRGVWKAPANVSLNAVVSPTVNITHDEQEDLNVTTQGKSINAIRSFIGEGTLVWGARTLDGNSLDWRYVNVRRTMIMLEESIRLASKAYVFEPNTANTWVTMKSMIRNFLTGIWKRGGLAGAVPDDAFSVHVGLGDTMTSEDILEGILRITVLVAISRPAEFIEITFQQQMQKS